MSSVRCRMHAAGDFWCTRSIALYTSRMEAQQRTRVIPANSYRRERWKNGLGWTREIARSADSGEWTWRLSIAEIEDDAPFSTFEGVDRELVLLAGNGLQLSFADGVQHTLLPPHDRLRFAGERGALGRLVDGPTQDFNLMWRRDAIDAQLWHRPLVGPMVVFVEPGSAWAIHLIAGQARFADHSGLPDLAAADTALLIGRDARQRYVIDGGGEVLVMRLQQHHASDTQSV
jgi:environmental stress-induced protein Ves